MNPTIKQLRAFAQVCRFGVLTRAADELFITQPAVSVLIRQMEEALGLRLIADVRDGSLETLFSEPVKTA